MIQFEAQPYDFASAFATGRKDGVQGLIILSSPVFVGNMGELSRLAVEYKLPSVGSGVPGVLVGYHGSIQGSARQAVGIGVRILKGAKPADIPVEQVDQFDLTINTSVARALRIKIPESVLARATRIIQ